ncbi:DUF6350 family protein [Corynebacterium capitovis]|uniref:cell division protein PerM n=1 Tax=Corynebacterium capitovis TaxID=131081 RepID=UPI0014615F2D|nr:DUF6350 family protein [Corynebacterium capitovis]
MSNKSSPRSSRSRPRRVAPKVAPPQSQERAKVTWAGRIRAFLPRVGPADLVIVLAVITLGLAIVIFGGLPLSALAAVIGTLWLAVHAAPVSMSGVTLAAVPLLPAVGTAALVARRVRAAVRDTEGKEDYIVVAGLALGLPLVLTLSALFMVADASPVYPVSVPPLARAVCVPLLVHAAGLGLGLGAKLGLPRTVKDAIRLLLMLLGVAGAVYVVLFIAGYQRVSDLAGAFPVLSAGGVLGLCVMSLLYLPNAVISTLAVLLGGRVAYASGSASLFAVDNIALPPLPVFAAIPGSVPAWAPVLLAIPAAVFVRWAMGSRHSLTDVALTAAYVGALTFFFAALAGGTAGAYGYIGPTPWMAGGLAFLWAEVVGAVAWGVEKLRTRRNG